MKLRYLLLLLICLGVSSCVVSKEEEQYGLSPSDVHELVRQYVGALDSLAQVMPIIGGDAESTWAAEQVSEQRNNLLGRDFSLYEGLAASYRMHNYISYGMTYFQSIIGLYGSAAEAAGYVMNMIPVSDSIYNCLEQSSFMDMAVFEDYYANTFLYAQMFGYLYNAQNDAQIFSENGLGHSSQSKDLLDGVQDLTPEIRFKMGRILEGASFYHTYCPLINGFATTQEMYDAQQSNMISHAMFFDENSNEVYQAIETKKYDIEILSDTGFAAFMKESTARKVWMLRQLSNEIRLIGEQQSEE